MAVKSEFRVMTTGVIDRPMPARLGPRAGSRMVLPAGPKPGSGAG
jgi:hypothetical protein